MDFTRKHMYCTIFLNIHTIFQNNLSPISTNGSSRTYITIFTNNYISCYCSQWMHETSFVNNWNISFENCKSFYLKRFQCFFCEFTISTNRPLIAARSANKLSQSSVPFQNIFFISFMASGLYVHKFSANVFYTFIQIFGSIQTLV